MKYILLISFWAGMLWSCREVSYSEPQPAGIASMKEVPPSLRGYFQTIDPASGEFSDTLIIESWGYHMKDKNDKDWLGRGVLSDSMVLKFYKDYYFVNFKSGNQWVLRLIKQDPDGSIQFLSIDLNDEVKRKDVLKRLSKKMKVTEIKKNDDIFYQINPSPAQLMVLIKEGFFTGTKIRKTKSIS
jgi:hypothetical protein